MGRTKPYDGHFIIKRNDLSGMDTIGTRIDHCLVPAGTLEKLAKALNSVLDDEDDFNIILTKKFDLILWCRIRKQSPEKIEHKVRSLTRAMARVGFKMSPLSSILGSKH